MNLRRSLRIVGLTMERVADFRNQPNAKNAGLYAALDRYFRIVQIARPEPSRTRFWYNKLRHFHPNRETWRAHASLSPWMFRQRTLVAEHQLQQLRGHYDLIVQLHTLFAPGLRAQHRPYVIHTDNTYALSERYYAPWAPLRGQQRAAWLDMERETYQGATYLFPRSEFLRCSLIEDYGCEPERVICVGGGANYASMPIATKHYDAQVAIFVGRDFTRKGGHVLLQAWEHVLRQRPTAQLWIVGPRRAYDKPMPGVRWFGFVPDRAALSKLYHQATVFVLPFLFEPWSHAFYEAMAHGLPCIGSDHCAAPEIIQHGRTGLLVPPGEPEPLAEALITLLDARRAQTMGAAAHHHVVQQQTWDDVVQRMQPYLEQACGITPLLSRTV